MRGTLALTCAAAFAVLTTPHAVAQDGEDGRFRMERVGEDLLRLDTRTGRVELCASSGASFACRTVVEPGAAGDDVPAVPASGEVLAENQALRAENATLRRRLALIAALVEGYDEPGGGDVDAPGVPPAARRTIDEAVEVTDYAVRRLRDLFEDLLDDGEATQGSQAQ